MKKLNVLTRMLLLVALLVGSIGNAWGQSDYSAVYTSNCTLSGATASTIVINSTNYSGQKAGTSKAGGSINIAVPSGTKYLHVHISGWSGETPSVSVSSSQAGVTTTTSITVTANSGFSGTGPTYNFSGDPSSSDYYKVITFTNPLESQTTLTFSTSGGKKRFVIWGVNAEAESSDPSSNATFANTTPSINFPAKTTYSQAPTTAAGYTGNISYEMTANTAGATIDTSTGLVTVTQEGSVTVKATAPAVTGFKKSEATYTLTVNDTRDEAGLAWSSSTKDINYDDTPYNLPTLTNTNKLTVTYSSSNTSVATIDENTGEVTVNNITGNTTISAIFNGDENYKNQTVSYTLNVTKGVYQIIDGVFDFDEAGSSDPLIDYGSGITLTSANAYYDESESTWVAGNVTMVVAGKYRWWYNGHELRFYNNDPASSATFSVPNGYYITKIVTTGGNFSSASTGSLETNTWTGVAQSVKLSIATSGVNFKKFEVTYTPAKINANVSAAGWATYATKYPMTFEDGDAYVIVSADGGTGTTTMSKVTSVPENTAVLLKGTAGEATEKTATIISGDAPSAPATNYLHIVEAGETINAESNVYVLAKKSEGIGFYPWTGTALARGKVYMRLPAGAKMGEFYGFGEEVNNETDGISNVSARSNKQGEFYNLAGQRVSNPTKGLYIVNGKKVIIK